MMLYVRYYVAICMAVCLCLDVNALAQDELEVLRNLKNYDSIYQSGFTVSGTRKCPEHLILGQLTIDVERKWRLAFEGDRCGYLMEMLEYEKPKFQEPEGDRGPFLDEDGWLLLPLRKRQWGYWGADVSGNNYEDTTMKISPENEVVEIGKMHNSLLFGPRDAGPNAPKRAILWSSGRFLSQVIDEVTLVTKSASGRIAVSALGRKGEGHPGRWELEIEPAAAWMVREARFYSDARPNVIDCEMQNSGTIWSGPYCTPSNALFNYGGPIKGATLRGDVEELTFDPVIEQFDEKLYEGAKQAVTEDRPPKLTIHDFRVSPPFIFQPDELSDIALDEIALDSILDSTLSDDNLVDASKAVDKSGKEVTPLAQRFWYLFPVKWAVVVLILAVVIVGFACILLFRSRKG